MKTGRSMIIIQPITSKFRLRYAAATGP